MTTAAHPTPGPSPLSASRPQSGLRAHTGHTLDSHLVRGQSRGSKLCLPWVWPTCWPPFKQVVWSGGSQSARGGPHGAAPITAADGECRGRRTQPEAGAACPGPRGHDPIRGDTLGPTLPRALLAWGLHSRAHTQALLGPEGSGPSGLATSSPSSGPTQPRCTPGQQGWQSGCRQSLGVEAGEPTPTSTSPSIEDGTGARNGNSSTASRPRTSWSERGS